MARDWPLIVNCGHEGCTERATYRYSTRRDLVGSFEAKNYTNGRWRCIRHSQPDSVLSRDNPTTRAELTLEEHPHGLFFGNSGFVHGPGFKAFASDFPPGTRLIVTASIELPNKDTPHG